MKTTFKKAIRIGLALLAISFIQQLSHAASTDTIQVSVTPGNVTYSVVISSVHANGYDFGTVNLGATTISTAAIVVTNNGNIAEYFGVAISSSSDAPADQWGPAVSTSTNHFNMRAYFNATQPVSTDFTVADDLTTSLPGSGANKYNQGTTKTDPSSSQNLWLRLIMPDMTTSFTSKTMTLSVNALSS